MKKALSLALALALALSCLSAAHASVAANANYTIAEKLVKQLWAGSGFSGTLLVSAAPNGDAAGVTLHKPMTFRVDYIHVRENGAVSAEERIDLALMEGETVNSAAQLQWKDEALSFQADWLGAEWFRLVPSLALAADGTGEANTGTVNAQLKSAAGNALARTAMPALLSGFLPVILSLDKQNAELEDVLESYLTRMDLWIEGYRQSAELGKTGDGTVTMEVRYAIAPAHIKAELKQIAQSLLADQATVDKLKNHFDLESVDQLLNPALTPYYIAAIEALPLDDNLTVSRTVSMKGDTLALHLSLPFYDAQSGNVTLSYDRQQGQDALSEETIIAIKGEKQTLELRCQEKSPQEGVSEIEGSFLSEPGEGAEQLPIDALFTLRRQWANDKDEENRELESTKYELSLSPNTARTAGEALAFEPLGLKLETVFASKAQKSASTELTATLEIGGEKRPQILTFALNGKTRKQWSPAALPAEMRDVNAMSLREMEAQLTAAALKAGVALLPYLTPGAEATDGNPEPGPAETAGVNPSSIPDAGASTIPEISETPSPEASPALTTAP